MPDFNELAKCKTADEVRDQQRAETIDFLKIIEKFVSVDLSIKIFGREVFVFHFPPKNH